MRWTPGEHLPDAFFEIPKRVYADDPFYIPEDLDTLVWKFGAHYDFFKRGEVWVGIEEGRARLVGFRHGDYEEGIVYFGYWETVDDFALNQRLFDQFETWAKAGGAHTVYGPINFNTYDTYRLQLSDFDRPVFPGEPHNPPYYVDFCERLGFQIESTYFSDLASLEEYHALSPRMELFRKRIEKRFSIQPLTRSYWWKHIDEFDALAKLSFAGNQRYSPISQRTFEQIIGSWIAQVMCPITSRYIRDSDGMLAGFLWIMPDFGDLTNQQAEPRVPLAELFYEKHFQRLYRPRALLKTVAIHPKYTGAGLYFAMAYHAYPALRARYDAMVGALMSEKSTHQLGFAAHRMNLRKYGLYKKCL